MSKEKNDPEFFCKQGVFAFNDRKHDTAIEYFTKAIEMDKENADYYNLRAHAFYANGEEKKAKSDFAKSKKLKSKGKKKKASSN